MKFVITMTLRMQKFIPGPIIGSSATSEVDPLALFRVQDSMSIRVVQSTLISFLNNAVHSINIIYLAFLSQWTNTKAKTIVL